MTLELPFVLDGRNWTEIALGMVPLLMGLGMVSLIIYVIRHWAEQPRGNLKGLLAAPVFGAIFLGTGLSFTLDGATDQIRFDASGLTRTNLAPFKWSGSIAWTDLAAVRVTMATGKNGGEWPGFLQLEPTGAAAPLSLDLMALRRDLGAPLLTLIAERAPQARFVPSFESVVRTVTQHSTPGNFSAFRVRGVSAATP